MATPGGGAVLCSPAADASIGSKSSVGLSWIQATPTLSSSIVVRKPSSSVSHSSLSSTARAAAAWLTTMASERTLFHHLVGFALGLGAARGSGA